MEELGASKKEKATKWTDEKVRTLKLDGDKPEQRVLVAPNLYLFMRRGRKGTVSKQWQYRSQLAGKRRWLSLGSYPEVGLAKAKDELGAHDKVFEAAKKGDADHPVIVARQGRKDALAQPTVDDVFEAMVADKLLGSSRKGGKPVRKRTIDVLRENYDADIKARIGDAKIDKTTRANWQHCIDAPRRRGSPGAAAQVYKTSRAIVNFAIKRDYISGADPMRGIENPRPYRPAPVVAADDGEIVDLLSDLDQSRLWPATKLAIELQLLTGARPGDIRLATLKEFDLKRRIWTIPADRFKMNREHRVHLSIQAVRVIERAQEIPRRPVSPGKPSSNVLLQGAKGGAMEKRAIGRALTRIAHRADGETKRLRPHDIRRTLRTLMSRVGVPPSIAELCIGHIGKDTLQRIYDGYDYETEMAAAWDRAGAHIQALRDGVPSNAGGPGIPDARQL